MGGSVPKPLRPAVKMAFGGDTSPSNVQAVKKSAEQPKVEAQMNNNVGGPAGPTDIELDQQALRTKRKGRRYSILTSSTGLESKPTLSTKTLLG